jgi:uncharacterized membrane protein
MQPDYLMIAAGSCALMAAIVVSFVNRRSRKAAVTGAILWVLLGVGLLTRGFSPNLETDGRVFKMPMVPENQTIRPKELVDQERQMQFLAALLTGGAALGLAFYHRSALIGGVKQPSGFKAPEGA